VFLRTTKRDIGDMFPNLVVDCHSLPLTDFWLRN
jgi:hypothetical protein